MLGLIRLRSIYQIYICFIGIDFSLSRHLYIIQKQTIYKHVYCISVYIKW